MNNTDRSIAIRNILGRRLTTYEKEKLEESFNCMYKKVIKRLEELKKTEKSLNILNSIDYLIESFNE